MRHPLVVTSRRRCTSHSISGLQTSSSTSSPSSSLLLSSSPFTLLLAIILLSSSITLLTSTTLAVTAAPTPSLLSCPNSCSHNGECVSGLCHCRTGYSGPDCSVTCPSLCNLHGICSQQGKCLCQPGYAGEDCSLVTSCPRSATDHPDLDCSGHGVCDTITATCICRSGYVGKDCSIDDGSCGSLHCSNHGTCSSGMCTCDLGYSGEHCESQTECPEDCSKHGICIGGSCQCYPGFTSTDCSQRDEQTCPGPNGGCGGNGVCSNGKCVCSVGYGGETCQPLTPESEPFCLLPNPCNGHGTCASNRCFCDPGFHGSRCDESGCGEKGCSKHGVCSVGKCRCEPGFTGEDCSKPIKCPKDCSGHGLCALGKCLCEPYYTGNDCSTLTLKSLSCPKGELNGKECSGNGICHLGQCFCEDSYSGPSCSTVKTCPQGECKNGGICRFDRCFCPAGYTGEQCQQEKKCSKKCLTHGICVKGSCKCAIGWRGDECQKKMSPEERQEELERDLLTSVRTQKIVASGKLSSPDSDAGRNMKLNTTTTKRARCGKLQHPCSAHGLCVAGSCVCEAGWTGADCSSVLHGSTSAICPGGCGTEQQGECMFGTCICHPGWSGSDCTTPVFLPCPNSCSRHGICHLGTCSCHSGFEGIACEKVKKCMKGCDNGVCIQGVCHCVHGFTGTQCETRLPADEVDKTYLSPNGIATCGTNKEGCGPHGVCLSGTCICVEGHTGTGCDIPLADYKARPSTEPTPANKQVSDIFGAASCTVNCGLHGVCIGRECTCVDGWAGKKCEKSVPLADKNSGVTQQVTQNEDFLAVMTAQKMKKKEGDEKKKSDAKKSKNKKANKKGKHTKSTTSTATTSSFFEHSSNTEADTDSEQEDEFYSEEDMIPQIPRTTAIPSESVLMEGDGPSSSSADRLGQQPTQQIGTDAKVVAPAPNQVKINNALAHGDSAVYSTSIHPWILIVLCFVTGVLVTLALRCLIDHRQQETRRKKKMKMLLGGS